MISNLDELYEYKSKLLDQNEKYIKEVHVCTGSSCQSLGASELLDELKKCKSDTCKVKGVGCNGLCSAGMLVSTKLKGETKLYENVTDQDIDCIVESFKSEKCVNRLLCDEDRKFFTKQKKIVLKNAGLIDPDSIDEYIMAGGYEALFDALTHKSKDEVIAEVITSKLRGRGGGGYPTGIKWDSIAKVDDDTKYVVCNGDEGDPGAFMDRAIMEADPHCVLEGMIIAGYAVGAKKGFIYVRAEYPLAVDKLKRAIKQAKKKGILGMKIAGTMFEFDIEVRLGGGAFVCGEATALVTSIEGNRGHPRQKPPHLSESGLFDKPTLLNNVETYANISSIIKHGGEWYASIGTPKSTGTKVFALTGQIRNTGLVEVPMGTTIRELIYDIGGGISSGKEYKAIQTGGPSGGCIPKEFLDMPIEYDTLKEIGSIMGSGGVIVMDSSTSMVDVAKFFIEFCKDESCGKCVPCRVGTVELSRLMDKFVNKEATVRDFEMLKRLCKMVKSTSLCGLGQTAPNPIESTIRYFENEYLEAIKNDG
jgi:bidirectional [NiFe] hydrogenase diaphorase subunit